MITDINNIYVYHNLFILFKLNILLIRIYSKFVFDIKTTIIISNHFDFYKYTINNFYFSKFYYNRICHKKSRNYDLFIELYLILSEII